MQVLNHLEIRKEYYTTITIPSGQTRNVRIVCPEENGNLLTEEQIKVLIEKALEGNGDGGDITIELTVDDIPELPPSKIVYSEEIPEEQRVFDERLIPFLNIDKIGEFSFSPEYEDLPEDAKPNEFRIGYETIRASTRRLEFKQILFNDDFGGDFSITVRSSNTPGDGQITYSGIRGRWQHGNESSGDFDIPQIWEKTITSEDLEENGSYIFTHEMGRKFINWAVFDSDGNSVFMDVNIVDDDEAEFKFEGYEIEGEWRIVIQG